MEEFVFAFLVFFICVFVVYRGIWVTDFECIRSASAGSLINCEWCDDLVFIFDSCRISGGDCIPGFGSSAVRGVSQGCLLFNIFLVKTMYEGLGSE